MKVIKCIQCKCGELIPLDEIPKEEKKERRGRPPKEPHKNNYKEF